MKRTALLFLAGIAAFSLISCKTTMTSGDISDKFKEENEEFLNGDNKGGEVFRVLLSSDQYRVVQLKNDKTITRGVDDGGDRYISSEIQKLDMINEARIGIISVWLYPDSGKIMKIRSQRPTYFKEVDALLNDDIMRWNFIFPKKVVEPTRFDIVYRVVLKKKKSDEEIIKAVQDKMKEGD